MLYLVLFILIAFLFFICLIINLGITLEYAGKKDYRHFTVTFSIFEGMIKKKLEISFDDLLKRYRGKEGFKKPGDVKAIYRKYKRLIRYVLEKLHLKKLRIYISAGTGDASQTGLICGAAWAVIGIMDSYLSGVFGNYDKIININPVFAKKELSADLSCIFIIKTVHIIVIVLKVFTGMIKDKFTDRRWFFWPDIRSKGL